ncbi:hypothetical protein T03_15061, partial [Trichinella britovi]
NGSSREKHEAHTSVEFGYLSERIESGEARSAHQSGVAKVVDIDPLGSMGCSKGSIKA